MTMTYMVAKEIRNITTSRARREFRRAYQSAEGMADLSYHISLVITRLGVSERAVRMVWDEACRLACGVEA